MGFLEVGVPLEYKDTKEYHDILDYVRDHGVAQFLNVWSHVKDRTNDVLLWGDEIEYHIFSREEPNRLVVKNCAAELLDKLIHEDSTLPEDQRLVTWHPEFGAWMLEATPSRPYGGLSSDLLKVEHNMRNRRKRANRALQEMGDLCLVSTTCWPRLGTPDFWSPRRPNEVLGGGPSQSLFIPDSCINPHPRFPTLTGNIRRRRGRKVDIKVPLFKDTATNESKLPHYTVATQDLKATETRGEIYMDAMGFGMGCCCLQVTFQARDLDESRHLYDQLAVLCPIFLALTAGTPVLKGLLADTDVRWSTISQSVDCRTPTELGVSQVASTLPGQEVPQRSHGVIRKSRYDSIDLYMSNHPSFKEKYNDMNSEVDEPTFTRLVQAGVDDRLAKHVAHLFIRDPLVIFGDRVKVDDTLTTEHFENIQSTNWQTMRWKPPPHNVPMGWRVEFRPMEVQFTDFENAAFTVIIMLCARVILFFDLVFYLPMSKVEENMNRAHARDGIHGKKFYFRKYLVPLAAQCGPTGVSEADEDAFEEMSIVDILCGRGDEFPGLIPLISAYLDIIQVDSETRGVVDDYIDLIVRRAKGELLTPATWIRRFISKHPAYKHDSVVSDVVSKDLVEEITKIAHGEKPCPELLGNHLICKLNEDEAIGRAELRLKLPGKALRGSSFHNDVGTTTQSTFQCAIVRALVEKHRGSMSAELRASVLVEGKGFDQIRPLFKRTKTQ